MLNHLKSNHLKLKHLKSIAIALAASSIVSLAHADSTVVYELTGTDGSKTQYTIAIRGPLLRLESIPKGKSDYTLMDTGRLLKFDVNNKTKSFQVTHMGRLYWPETALNSPKFKPVAKKKTASGVSCQPVSEIGKNNQPVAEHCMSSGGSLRLNAREMITLSRLFMSVRRMSNKLSNSWLGVATPDERQVSILSHNPAGDKLLLKSVTLGRMDKTLLKVPNDYKRLKPDLPIKQAAPVKGIPVKTPQ